MSLVKSQTTVVRLLQPLLAAAALVSGCGSVAKDNAEPGPLAVLKGTVTNSLVNDAPATVHVALVWLVPTESEDPQFLWSATELEIDAAFPARFDIAIDELPPAEAMSVDGGTRIAWGSLVAYDDTNGSGTFDLSADTVLGALDTTWVVYLEGEALAAADGFPAVPAGFSLMLPHVRSSAEAAAYQQCNDLAGDDEEALAACSGLYPAVEIAPTSTEIALELTETPMLPGLLCLAAWPTAMLDDYSTQELVCDADGRGYTLVGYCMTEEETINALCGWCVPDTIVRLGDGDSLPDDWPCIAR